MTSKKKSLLLFHHKTVGVVVDQFLASHSLQHKKKKRSQAKISNYPISIQNNVQISEKFIRVSLFLYLDREDKIMGNMLTPTKDKNFAFVSIMVVITRPKV